MNYEICFTRLANSHKLTDRYLTIQVLKPTDPDKSSMGTIFTLVEITNPWLANSRIGQNIINTLAQEYYKKEDDNAINNFESSLKKVNLNLIKNIEEGETNWLGNLNSILALVVKNEIHLARTGKAEAFLIRDGAINRINRDYNLEKQADPSRTFTEITSGQLKKGDKFLIASSCLLDYLSQQEILDIILEGSTYESIETLAQFLIKNKAKHINAVLIEISSKSELENTLLDKNDVIYLDQINNFSIMNSLAKNLPEKISPKFDLLGNEIKNTWNKTKFFFHNKIKPHTKSAWEKTKKISQKGYTHFSTKTTPQIKKFLKPISEKIHQRISKQFNKDDKKNNHSFKLKTNNITSESYKPYSINYYEEKKTIQKNVFSSNLISTTDSLLTKIKDLFKRILTDKNHFAIYFIILTVLLATLASSIVHLKNKQIAKIQTEEENQKFNTAKDKYEEAKLAILYNEPQKAKKLLNEAIEMLTEIIKNNPNLKEDANELITKANIEFDKLTFTTRFNNPKEIANFPEAQKIFMNENTLIATNNKDNIIYYKNSTNSDYSETKKLESQKGIYTAFTLDAKQNSFYMLTNKNNLFILKNLTAEPEEISPSQGDWEKAIDMALFLDNLYLLDPEEGQIWKHSKNNNSYGPGKNYVDKNKINLQNSISMAIDGSIYVLKKNGEIIKLNKGNQQDFAPTGIPEPLDKIVDAKKIWTNSEINSIYILDGNRIIELDKEAKFLRQYAFSPELQNIKDFIIDIVNKKIWVLNDTKVFQVEF